VARLIVTRERRVRVRLCMAPPSMLHSFSMRNPKTFYIRTYGCQMNELDSAVMAGLLEKKGLLAVEREEEADLLIFNTCAIRDLAERKVMGKIGRMDGDLASRPIIGVTGCMAMAKKGTLFQK